MNKNDCILAYFGPGHISDVLHAFYLDGGATSEDVNDAEYQWLVIQGATPGPVDDMWYEYLTGLGLTGTLDDMKNYFWCVTSMPT